MPSVENDTEEGVEYTVEEGEGTSSFTFCVPLESGQTKELTLSNQYFNIFFYRKGSQGAQLACRRRVHQDCSVRLHCPAPGRWEVDVRPAKAA